MSVITLVALGPEGADAALAPRDLVGDRVALEEIVEPEELEAIASRATVLWLPAWTRLAAGDWLAVRHWLAGSAPVARAQLSIAGPSSAAPAGRALVLSRPGAAGLRLGVPTARARGGVDLPGPWVQAPPAALADHLQGVNRQTSAAVRLSSDPDVAPGIGALVRPLAALPLRLAAGRGPARDRLARSVLEAYRGVLLAAKSWERRHAPPARTA